MKTAKQNTIHSLSRKIGPRSIDCYSHRYNLAVKDTLFDDQTITENVHNVMICLSFQIISAKLHQLTPFKAQTADDTRWSSCCPRISRFLGKNQQINEVDDSDVQDLLLTKDEVLEI